MQMLGLQLGEMRSSFPSYRAVSRACQQERVGCVIISQAPLWQGASHLQRQAPASPAEAGSLAVPLHFPIMAHSGAWTAGVGLHRVISGSQSLFLWLGIMRCTKAWRGERWQRGRLVGEN